MSSSGPGGGDGHRPKQVAGPRGHAITIESLPPPDTRRWVTRRKAEVVAAVDVGLLTLEEACTRYGLTPEELSSWQRLVAAHGVRGLRVTRLKDYRSRTDPDGQGSSETAESEAARAGDAHTAAPTHG
jgi:hypothetical protein